MILLASTIKADLFSTTNSPMGFIQHWLKYSRLKWLDRSDPWYLYVFSFFLFEKTTVLLFAIFFENVSLTYYWLRCNYLALLRVFLVSSFQKITGMILSLIWPQKSWEGFEEFRNVFTFEMFIEAILFDQNCKDWSPGVVSSTRCLEFLKNCGDFVCRVCCNFFSTWF